MAYTIWGNYFATASSTRDEDMAQFEFTTTSVGEVVAHFERARKVLIFEPTDTLNSLMKHLSFHDRRALVVQKSDIDGQKTYRIISQSDVLRYLQSHSDKFVSKVVTSKIQELGLVNPLGSPVLTIPITAQALQGYHKMFSHRVPSIGVVDEEDRLIATLSASDLRGITSDKLKFLRLPVMEFVFKMTGEKPFVPVSCKPTATLEQVILQAITARVHRVWVVNSKQTPIGTISFSDCLKVLLYGHVESYKQRV